MEMCEIRPTAIVNCRHSDGVAKRRELGLAFIEVRQQDYIVLVIRISSWRETRESVPVKDRTCTLDHTTSGTSWTSSRCTSVTKASSFVLLEQFVSGSANAVFDARERYYKRVTKGFGYVAYGLTRKDEGVWLVIGSTPESNKYCNYDWTWVWEVETNTDRPAYEVLLDSTLQW